MPEQRVTINTDTHVIVKRAHIRDLVLISQYLDHDLLTPAVARFKIVAEQ